MYSKTVICDIIYLFKNALIVTKTSKQAFTILLKLNNFFLYFRKFVRESYENNCSFWRFIYSIDFFSSGDIELRKKGM